MKSKLKHYRMIVKYIFTDQTDKVVKMYHSTELMFAGFFQYGLSGPTDTYCNVKNLLKTHGYVLSAYLPDCLDFMEQNNIGFKK